MLSEQTIIEALKTVYDPEIPVNIYDLGLIYEVKLTDGNVHIVMTLTTATCPAPGAVSSATSSCNRCWRTAARWRKWSTATRRTT